MSQIILYNSSIIQQLLKSILTSRYSSLHFFTIPYIFLQLLTSPYSSLHLLTASYSSLYFLTVSYNSLYFLTAYSCIETQNRTDPKSSKQADSATPRRPYVSFLSWLVQPKTTQTCQSAREWGIESINEGFPDSCEKMDLAGSTKKTGFIGIPVSWRL